MCNLSIGKSGNKFSILRFIQFLNVKETLLTNWHFARILRLTLGIVIIIQGMIEHEIAFTLLGVAFAGMAVFNAGCCGPAGCRTSFSNKEELAENKDVNYEEVD